MFSIYFTCVLCCLSVIEGQEFRSDYTHFSQINGWMKYHSIPANWFDARLRCHLEGAVLVSPLNEELRSAMFSLMKGKTSLVYVGIHATFSKGDFTSIEGIPLSSIPGRFNFDNKNDEESCVVMSDSEYLNDVKCSNVYPYICFKEFDQAAKTQNECGTIDNEYHLEPETGSCYKFHREPMTWSRAFMTCTAEGGYLVIINNEAESRILSRIFNAVPKNAIKIIQGNLVAHVGFQDWGEHGTWRTVHGQTLEEAGFAQWAGNGREPNNVTGAQTHWVGESCGSIDTDGKFNDLWCDYAVSFICEKNPESLSVNSKETLIKKPE